MLRRFYRRLRSAARDVGAQWALARIERSGEVPSVAAIKNARGTLHRILHRNILPFWFPAVIDDRAGGYRIGDARAPRQLVGQARTLWFASRLLNSAHAAPDHHHWARHGWTFLKDRFWDHDHGGFYWSVEAEGAVNGPDKHLYGQAFALYAVSEYALATNDPEAGAMARHLFQLLEAHAHDPAHGGYHEYLLRDWRRPEPPVGSYLGVRSDLKQLNTHLHLLEAFTRYAAVTDDALVKRRLDELRLIVDERVVRWPIGAATDLHDAAWGPLAGREHDRVTYGHDLESLWLGLEASQAIGQSLAPLRDAYEIRFRAALRYGWDHRNGGFFYAGALGRPADQRRKVWWVQAEALVCSLWMHLLTGRAMYFQVFERTLEWLVRRQIDWNGGEWHLRVDVGGSPSGDKASDRPGAWKTPYHNGRAMIRGLELLERIAAGGSAGAKSERSS